MWVGDGPSKIVSLYDISGVIREEIILVFVIHVLIVHDTDSNLEFLVRKDGNGLVRSKGLLMD